MYLDWALLHWCFSLLCLMGAPGLPGLVGQMGRGVPGPIWVLNGLSSVRLPSWFPSHVTRPCSERSAWLHSPGSSHQVCFNPGTHRKHSTRRYLNLHDPTRWTSAPERWSPDIRTLCVPFTASCLSALKRKAENIDRCEAISPASLSYVLHDQGILLRMVSFSILQRSDITQLIYGEA